VIRALREAPLFSQCSDQDYMAIARFCEYVYSAPDTTLFHEGAPSEAFYLVVEGLIALTKGAGGHKEKVIEFIESGQTFAEAVVISEEPYPVTATGLTDCRLIRIDAEDFRAYLLRHPSVSLGMLSALSKRLHQLVGQISSLSLLNAEQRVAEYLMEHREGPADALRCSLPNPRRVLASRLNLTPETLCRVLTLFRQREWIDIDSASSVRILNSDRLQQLVSRAPDKAGH